MIEKKGLAERLALDRATRLVEAALRECDEHGFLFAAIDLSSALDKLESLRANHPES